MKQHWFIAGTDTDVGKTHVTAMLLRHLRDKGRRVAGYKPVCSGGRTDAVALQAASSPQPELEIINPVWFKAPLAPYTASLIENRPVELERLVAGFEHLAADYDHVLVEGAGGWETPLAKGLTMADLAQKLALPVILVVNNRLGAINHTLLTLQAIAARGLVCKGLVLNYVADERDAASISNAAMLAEFSTAPVLGEVMHGMEDWWDEFP
jgi:dethiobiotin synthetase